MLWGCDYSDGLQDELQFILVDAQSEEEARKEVHKILKASNIPQRNIVNLFKIDL